MKVTTSGGLSINSTKNVSKDPYVLQGSEVGLLLHNMPSLAFSAMNTVGAFSPHHAKTMDLCIRHSRYLLQCLARNEDHGLSFSTIPVIKEKFLGPLFTSTGLKPFGFITYLSEVCALPFTEEELKKMIAYFETLGLDEEFHSLFKCLLINNFLIDKQYRELIVNRGEWFSNPFFLECLDYTSLVTSPPNMYSKQFCVSFC